MGKKQRIIVRKRHNRNRFFSHSQRHVCAPLYQNKLQFRPIQFHPRFLVVHLFLSDCYLDLTIEFVITFLLLSTSLTYIHRPGIDSTAAKNIFALFDVILFHWAYCNVIVCGVNKHCAVVIAQYRDAQ